MFIKKKKIIICLGFLIFIYFKVTNQEQAQLPSCIYECDEVNDLHCKSTFACERDYRLCCNGNCTLKKDRCPSSASGATYTRHDRLNKAESEAYWRSVAKNTTSYKNQIQCYPAHKCINETTCETKFHQCSEGKCVRLLSQCKNSWSVNDDFRERNLTNTTCYPYEFCQDQKCTKKFWMCDDGECIFKSLVCRGGLQCTDGSDEKYCSGNCYPPHRCKKGDCAFGYYKCGNGQCILQEEVCDTIKQCEGGEDELGCEMPCWPMSACTAEKTCKSGYFPCDQGKCISSSRVCNSVPNCNDKTDEIRQGRGFKCHIGKQMKSCVMPQHVALDEYRRCPDHSDMCTVNGTFRCFNCLDGRLVISGKQKCDGVIDCYDLSDECFCEDHSISTCSSICTHASTYDRQLTIDGLNDLYSNDTALTQDLSGHDSFFPSTTLYELPSSVLKWCMCSPGQFDCENGICLDISKICDNVNDCNDTADNSLDERHCTNHEIAKENTILCPGNVKNTTLIRAVVCDGRPECLDLADECSENCNFTLPFCDIKYKLGNSGPPFEFMCNVKNKHTFFDVGLLCDGMWTDCFPRIDVEEMGCPARFYCKSRGKISIDKDLVCDGVPQCDDMSDELECANLFYCENGIPFSVPRKKMADGVADCTDQSDECPKDMDENVFSSRKELLSSPVLRVMTWIFAFLATLGNAVTFVGSAYAMRGYSKMNPVSRINNLLLLNLSMADFLMGLYLITLLYHSLYFSGQYCKHDKMWRTSSMCSHLGALALLSSEASVFIIVSLTSLRLYSVLQPFKVKNMPIYIPIVGLVFSWLVAIVLSASPLLKSLKDYFISAVHLTTNFAGSDLMNKQEFSRFIHRLAITKPTNNIPPVTESWDKLSHYLRKNYKKYDVKLSGYVGYYNENSVCLPKFYVSLGDASWEYSFGIVTFNFIAFLFVCVAYWIIFRRTTAVSNTKSKKLRKIQTRIMLLILTDFLCWMPLTIMATLQLGGVQIPNIAYAISAVVLLPINSAVNPLLYSDITSGHLMSMLRLFSSASFKSCLPCRRLLRLIGRDNGGDNCEIDKQSGVYIGTHMSLKPACDRSKCDNPQTAVSEFNS